jgi:glycosyltransferase involved in cell wall biosynthesis
MKVLMLLSNAYWPDTRVEKEAGALAEAGHAVTVFSWDRLRRHPSVMALTGFEVRWFRTWASQGPRFVSFPLFVLRSVIIALRADCDVIHCHDFDTLPQGVLAARLRRKKLVYDSHEHYSMMIAVDVGRAPAAVVDRLEGRLVRKADLVIGANANVLDHLKANIRGDGVEIMNAVDASLVRGLKIRERGPAEAGKIVIFYGGSLEPQRYIVELVQEVLSDDRLVLRVAGKGRLEGAVREAAAHCPRVAFLGYVSQSEVLTETASCDLVFSMVDVRNVNYRIGTPIKVLEAMTAGVPVMVSKGTLAAEMVEEAGAGLAIEWSPERFREAVDSLMDSRKRAEMGRNGREAALRRYDWAEMKRRLLKAYGDLTA